MRKEIGVLVFLTVLAVLVTAVAAASAFSASPVHRTDRFRMGNPWGNNTQVTTTETVVEGVIVDADWRLLEVDVGGSVQRIAAPHVWQVGGQTKTYFKLFAEDLLNFGDSVRITVVTVTVTKPSGATFTVSYAKQIIDLTTGVEASAITPPARVRQTA